MSIEEFSLQIQHQDNDDLVAACTSPSTGQWQVLAGRQSNDDLQMAPWDMWA